ncbi:MAG: hypothetical protein M3Z24_02720 [Chloroflexota bacterium]|nr:hypothetical protein [Chloroflexota bacterium]
MTARINGHAAPVGEPIPELRGRTSHWTSVMNAATTLLTYLVYVVKLHIGPYQRLATKRA